MPYDWKVFWPRLLKLVLLAGVWGVISWSLDLRSRLGWPFEIVNLAVIAGFVFWFFRGLQEVPKAEAEGETTATDDEEAAADEGNSKTEK